MSKQYFHRQKLAAVPANGFVAVLKDSNEDVGAVPEYMPLSLLSSATPSGQLAPVYADGANQALSGAGAVTLTGPITLYTSSVGPDALTLADATVVGLVKTVTHVVDGGSGVLTPASFEDGTDITFTNVNDTWTGMWTGTAWRTIAVSGAVIG